MTGIASPPAQEQPDEELACAGRPRVADRRRALGETFERIAIDDGRELGREARGAEGKERVVGRVDVAGDVYFSVAQDRPPHRAHGRACRYDRAVRERRTNSAPRIVARPCDRACSGRDVRHERVGVAEVELLGYGVLLLEREHVARASGAPVQLDARRRGASRTRTQDCSRHVRGGCCAAACAQRSECTSRRPPRPSLRSGSSMNATSPACT